MTARSRSRSKLLSTDSIAQRSTNPALVADYGPFNTGFRNESMDDVVTANYHKRIAAGEIINNPVSYRSELTKSSGSGHATFTNNGNGDQYTQSGCITHGRALSIPPVWDLENPSSSVDESQAKLKAIAGLDSTPYAFGEDMLEVKETLKFIRNPILSLYHLSRDFHNLVRSKSSKKLLTADQLSKSVAENWLAMRFAVSPLVKSIHDVVELLTTSDKTLPARLTSRGFSFWEFDAAKQDVPAGVPTILYDLTRRREELGHAQILYEVTNPVYDWRYRLGVRNKDIPATIWAVMPYSFMVDRVIDITGAIQSVMNLSDPNLNILSGSYSLRSEHETSYSWVADLNPSFTNFVGGETISETSFSLDRTPWHPSFSDAIPGIKLSGLWADLTKTVDLLSLIRQNFQPNLRKSK